MRYRDKSIKNINELLTNLKKDTANIKTPIWFRGHAKATFKLVPGFYRNRKQLHESNLIEKFKQNATLLLNEIKREDIDWLFIMQHNGVPTRLLDWTESPLVALYFSCINYPKNDGYIYMLLPVELNHHASIKQKYIVSINDETIRQRYSPEAFKSEDTSTMNPLAIICPRNNPRIQAQLGTFTIFHKDKTPIEQIDNKKHVWRYKITAKYKSSIIKELALLGIDEFRLFPELPSLGTIIKKTL